MMRVTTLALIITMIILVFTDGRANGQTVLAPQEAAAIVRVQDSKATPALVSGVIVNNTGHIIRDIEVLIEYHWLWANEFKPGPESPGRVVSFKIDKELAPGQSTAFRYTPDPPLSQRDDGHYDLEVTVASFTTVMQGAR